MLFSKTSIKSFNIHNYLKMCDLAYKHSFKQYKNVNPTKITVAVQDFNISSIKNSQIKSFLYFFFSFGQNPYFKLENKIQDSRTKKLIISVLDPIYVHQLLLYLFLFSNCRSYLIFSFNTKKKLLSFKIPKKNKNIYLKKKDFSLKIIVN
jgi:hypothetical protein